MVLGCAKGEEIALQDVVILPVRPPSAADASVDSGSEPAPTTNETSIPAPVGAPAAAAIEAGDAAPDTELTDAGLPPLGDSGT